jgi:NAD(P)-dependent dehydrogenase (short-subunit alcohol dehydrogenase family)
MEGRAALVTGAAGGLGLAFAQVLHDAGAWVTMVDFDATKLDAAAKAVGDPDRVRTAICDVTDEAALANVFDTANRWHDRLDVVFANAGIDSGAAGAMDWQGQPQEIGAMENVEIGRWHRTLDVNLTGVFHTLRQASRVMKPRRSGRIIVTSSVVAERNQTSIGIPYPVSKAAVSHLTRNAALELAPFGITVNAIAPGTFVTDIAGGAVRSPDVQAAIGRMVPMGRVGQAEEIKGLALFLASDASSYVTGAHLAIDGGLAIAGF